MPKRSVALPSVANKFDQQIWLSEFGYSLTTDSAVPIPNLSILDSQHRVSREINLEINAKAEAAGEV
ncbi:MAG: hypothetical protein KME07_06860 [Pegethrix bostrychoides GSE-TBD4-15B]|jgi:hypothetical protein|uniref:Uncharacterized protein n=1 Tax=Pegethrix bostrychoides GSE-TBD4-15B TaxID=2839662 RepID=A0A951P9D7_9CYAN|nr:hypothetical protein [Pegethrix bostrychoides GSE-TBD4-15B]